MTARPSHAATGRHGPGIRLAAVAALVVLCSACATTSPAGGGDRAGGAAPSVDPWERLNRRVFAFNDRVDRALLAPVARAYRDHVPQIVRTSVGNVLGNLYDAWSAVNHLLQGKLQSGVEMGMRVLTNTVLGAGGIMDPASEMGLAKRSEDFGQTLGRWGVPNGPYVVLPLLGSSTVRDTTGFLVDRQVGPSSLPETHAGQYTVVATEVVNARANLLAAGSLVDQVALDRYAFLRDAYLARRRDAVADGAVSVDNGFEDPGDSPPPPGPGTGTAPGSASPAAAAASAASAPGAAR